jgi:hypothetical protein
VDAAVLRKLTQVPKKGRPNRFLDRLPGPQ